MAEGNACIDPQNLSAKENYFLLTSLVVPRPIAWVSTVDCHGYHNLAPFSFFNGVCSDPPTISICIVDKLDGPKDTLRGLKDTGSFCVNLVEEHHAKAMHLSSGAFAAQDSEFELAGLSTSPCMSTPARRVVGARAALECKVIDHHVYGNKTKCNLIIAEVMLVHLEPGCGPQAVYGGQYENGTCRPVGRWVLCLPKAPFKLPAVDVDAVKAARQP